jgi:hypothetical protein
MVDELKRKFAEQAVAAAHDREGYKNGIDGIESSLKGLHFMVARILGGEGRGPTPDQPPANVPEPLVPTQVIREIADAQIKAIESSRAAMDKTRADIDDIVAQVTKEMADLNEIHVKEMQGISEELDKLTIAAQDWDEERKIFEGRQASLERERALLQSQLDALRQQGRVSWQSFQDIGQQDSQQPQSVDGEAADAASERSWISQPPFPTSFGPGRPSRGSEVMPFRAGAHEIEHLHGARRLIKRLRDDLQVMAAGEALRECVDQLHILHDTLKSLAPNTPTEDLIVGLGKFLEECLAGITENNDLRLFYNELEQHDMYLQGMLELEHYTSTQSDSERDLLRGLGDRMRKVETLQKNQVELCKEYETYRSQHAYQPLSSRQSNKLMRLVSSFVESTGDIWSLRTPTGQEGTAAVAQLVAQIQELIADSTLAEKRRQLQAIVKSQADLVAEVRQQNPRLMRLVDLARRQMEAFNRLQEQPGTADTKVDDSWKAAFEANSKRRERRLKFEHDFNEAYIKQLDAERATAQAFLDSEVASDRHRAEQLLTETLLRIHASTPPSQHGEAACFCTLLRHLFPRVYYATIKDGCCAGGGTAPSGEPTVPDQGLAPDQEAAPDQGAVPPYQRHHGHGALSLLWRGWPSICRILTSIIWLLLLILTQPSNILTTAAFLLSVTLGLPAYLYQLASFAASATSSRIRRRVANGPGEGQETEHSPPPAQPQPPKIPRPQIPPASTLVGSAITLLLAYAWLSYVAVSAERRIWMAHNDWRYAYVADLTAAKPSPTYPDWSPVVVDYRLVTQPVWVWFEEGVHSLFKWRRGAGLGQQHRVGLLGGAGEQVGGGVAGWAGRLIGGEGGWGYGDKMGNVSSYQRLR